MIFIILGYFLPFHHPDYLENQNFQKLKKKKTPQQLEILLFSTCAL